MYDYEFQWSQIMKDNLYTEEAVISDDATVHIVVHGIYYSGSYEEDSPAPYAPKKFEDRDGFQVASSEIPETLEDPRKNLIGLTLFLPGRGLSFRVQAVTGNHGGMYTLKLRTIKQVD